MKKTRDYTVMCNTALDDQRLSLKAKGMYAVLMSKPENWNVSYRGMQTQLKEGQSAILAALKELEECGYLVRRSARDEKGRIYRYNELYERPVFTTGRKSTHGKSTQLVSTEKLNTHQEHDSKEEKIATLRAAVMRSVTV
ncbi:hypothetical protein GS464_29525 [Rhodococcus hoagii]|nr:hypothetical protein [Prescottella equi]